MKMAPLMGLVVRLPSNVCRGKKRELWVRCEGVRCEAVRCEGVRCEGVRCEGVRV